MNSISVRSIHCIRTRSTQCQMYTIYEVDDPASMKNGQGPFFSAETAGVDASADLIISRTRCSHRVFRLYRGWNGGMSVVVRTTSDLVTTINKYSTLRTYILVTRRNAHIRSSARLLSSRKIDNWRFNTFSFRLCIPVRHWTWQTRRVWSLICQHLTRTGQSTTIDS